MQISDRCDVWSEQVSVRQGVFFTAGDKYRMQIVLVWQSVARRLCHFYFSRKYENTENVKIHTKYKKQKH